MDTTTIREDGPARVGEFTVGRRIGRGGEAAVYSAFSPRTGSVALKVRTIGDFATEFALGRRVDPEVTARPVTHGTAGAGEYLAMERLDGYAPITPVDHVDDLWRIATRTAGALADIHDAGIVHCDVKPGNILVRGHDLRLIDFGIARDVADQPPPDRIVHCSRGWAAPEQLSTGPLTTATDVFGWGCTIAFVATGESPYRSATEQEWIVRVRLTTPDLRGLPECLIPPVRAALERDPAARPSAAELAADLAAECDRRSRTRTDSAATRTARPDRPIDPADDDRTLAFAA